VGDIGDYRRELALAVEGGGVKNVLAPNMPLDEAGVLLQDMIVRHKRITDQQARLLVDLRKLLGPKWIDLVELEDISLRLNAEYLMSLLVTLKEADDELVARLRL
jgi:hypothetical protein